MLHKVHVKSHSKSCDGSALSGPIQYSHASFIKELSKNNCVVCDNSITHNIDFPQAQMYKKKNKIVVAAQKASQ